MCDTAFGLCLRDLEIAVALRGEAPRTLLRIAALDLPAGARVGISGPSGCGKTSLLHALVGIAPPAAGRIAWGGTDIAALPGRARDAWRLRHAGIVFQEMHLLPGMNVRANVLLPACFDHLRPPPELAARADALLARLGLAHAGQRIESLSRGEGQRVALARALLRRPRVIVADEPTASLDDAAAAIVAELLTGMARETGATLIAASHDPRLLDRLDTRYAIAANTLQVAG